MWKSWKFWAVATAIAGVMGVFTFGFTVNPKLMKSPLVGKPAPVFSVRRLGGAETLTLAELKGKPVLLNFWASWCVACRDEAPILKAAHNLYEKGQDKLRVVGIAIQDTEEKALAFAKRFGKNYFLALDNEAGDISLRYGLYGVPETFFIDAQGTIRYKHVGALTAELVRRQLENLMAPPREQRP